MHVLEDFRQLHSQPGQFVDIEKPSVIDIVGGRSEMRDTPVLFLNQIVQCCQLAASLSLPSKRFSAT